MKSPDVDTATGLGVAGVELASASSSSPSPSSPSITRTPRWGSIRQRFSSISSTYSPSVPVDSVDDGMWDKNDAAFLEDIARSSPLLLASPDRFDTLAPVFEDNLARRSSMSSSREQHAFPSHQSHLHRQSMQPRPSSASGSTPSSTASAASPMSTPVFTNVEMTGLSNAFASSKPWLRPMLSIASATVLPDLLEQNGADDVVTRRRPSTASSVTHANASTPLLPPIRFSSSFMSNAFAHFQSLQSHGDKGSTHSSVRNSPNLAQGVEISNDAARSVVPEQYPRSPSIHSSSSFTISGYAFRFVDSRDNDLGARTRTVSSASTSSSAAGFDRCGPRGTVGSPLAMRRSFSTSRPSSPDAFLPDASTTVTLDSRSDLRTAGPDSTRRPSIASVLNSPHVGIMAADTQQANHGKRTASSSMRGVPGSPTKRSSIIATSSTTAVPVTSPTTSASSAPPTGLLRKHTKNKSSLVSGLRKLMGKREKDSKEPATLTALTQAKTESTLHFPSLSLEQSNVGHAHAMRSRAMSIDATPSRGGLNLFGMPSEGFGAGSADHGPKRKGQDGIGHTGQDGMHGSDVSQRMSRRAPSLDLLRNFGSKASQPISAEGDATPADTRSRTKSIDGLSRPLRDVLMPRARKSSISQAAPQNSVIEHISYDEARRLTGSTGPVILHTKEELEEHRSAYATFPSEIGLPDRANFDMHHQLSLPSGASYERDRRVSQSGVGAKVQSPTRPPRAAESDLLASAPLESNLGTASGAGSSNFGGVSSSGSSMISASSAATDPALGLRAPFQFQSQTYRPISRESRGSHKAQLSPPVSPSKHSFQFPGDAALAFAPSGLASGVATSGGKTSSMMPPPETVQTAKRGHHGRRSLNSLVGRKPWSSLIGSPMPTVSSSHGHKRVSTMSISRPMSASSSAFSSDLYDLSADVADLTLRPSEFGGNSRVRAESTQSNISEPPLKAWQPEFGAKASNVHIRSHLHSFSHSHLPTGHNNYNNFTLAPPASHVASSSSSQHSNHSFHSLSSQGAPNASASASSTALAPAIASALHRLIPANSAKGIDETHTPTALTPSFHLLTPTLSGPRPLGAGHRASHSGSSPSHRKRPSFGLAIEPAAHSAFDSIPSPLLRTRHTSLALPEGARPARPFSSSSASAARTPSGSSASSPNRSERAPAATLSSSYVFDGEEGVEIETLRDGSPVKKAFNGSAPVLDTDMEAASPERSSHHRHSVSVPMDEGDSPRQHQEESWNRATGGAEHTSAADLDSSAAAMPRSYMIHSPNEEEGPALTMPETSSSSTRLSQATKDIAFGSIAGMVSKVFEHPFDLVKVRLQTQSADRPPRYAGAFDCFKQTYLQEGIRGLYRGLSMPVLGATLENACLFFTYNQIQSAIRWANGEARSASAAKADAESPLSISQLAIAAAGAGAVTSLVLTPIELIKCKMQVQMITREQHATQPAAANTSTIAASQGARPQLQQHRSLFTSALRSASAGSAASAQTFKSLDGPLTLLRRTIAADGIRGLWLGQTGTLLRETGGGVAWFLAFESCSRYLIARKKAQWNRTDVTKKDLTSLELVGAGALAGISYNVVLFPADCVKSTMQTEQEMRAISPNAVAGEKWKGTGFYDTFKKIYRTRGIRGLYAGCGVTCLRSAPSSAIIFLMYNKLEKLSDEYGL